MDLVLFAVVVLVAAFWVAVTITGFMLSRLRDWALAPVSASARARREDREEKRQHEWERFIAGAQPLRESLRRPYHDATNMREFRRLLRDEVRQRDRGRVRKGAARQ